jgi:hypothetical protein
MHGAEAASDHHLNIASLKIKLKAYRCHAERPFYKYNAHSLKDSVKSTAFGYELRNRLSTLNSLPN